MQSLSKKIKAQINFQNGYQWKCLYSIKNAWVYQWVYQWVYELCLLQKTANALLILTGYSSSANRL